MKEFRIGDIWEYGAGHLIKIITRERMIFLDAGIGKSIDASDILGIMPSGGWYIDEKLLIKLVEKKVRNYNCPTSMGARRRK